MAIALILILIVVGSTLFHVLSPWWWTPIASNWVYIDTTLVITFWITGIVFIAVVLFLAYCVIRFRHKPGRRAAYEPENRRLELGLTGVTSVGIAAMLAPGLFVWNQFINVPDEAMPVEVFGQQWSWAYRFPGEDGVLGRTDARLIAFDNPLGLDPDDPAGQDDLIVLGGPLHLPVGQPVHLLLRSADVLHNYYVPEFRAKMDMVPGMVTYYWFTPTRTGAFEAICAELCGVGHAVMRGEVVVQTEADFEAWLAEQETFAEMAARTAPVRVGAAETLISDPGKRARTER